MAKNILLIVADDLGKQLGCYGCPYISTPHLDALASEPGAVRFTRAFASTASCSGSRSTLYTGLHTHQNGQYGLGSGKHHFMTFDHVDTAPAILQRQGYRTGIIGKVHVGPDAVYPWEVREESFTRDVSWTAERAAAFFDNKDSRPFALTVAFHDPHRDQTRGGFGNDEPVNTDVVQRWHYEPADMEVPGFLSDTPGVRQELASYAHAISRMDQGVGLVLAALSAAGLQDNTLVVFLSDNGPPFINSKTTLYDAGTCLPLIVRRPERTSPVVNPNLVSYVDVLPTLLEWALGHQPDLRPGAPPLSGRSFLSILGAADELPGWDHVFGSHTFHESTNYWPTRTLRTRQYKYHRNIAWRLDFPFANDLYGSLSWEDVRNGRAKDGKGPLQIGQRLLRDYFFRPPEQLFDLVADPLEVHDLAQDQSEAIRALVVDMRGRLEDWQRRTDDPWLYRDGVSVLLNKRHLDAGMAMPDRWDLDVENLGTQNVPLYVNKPFGERP